jgi:predicted DsbA family dithiol-disulfide isomerase
MDRRAYLENKFAGQEAAAKAYAPVMEHAEKAGVKINLEAIEKTPNTLDAHRLIHWAGIEGHQLFVVDALFKAYFVEGRDIGDRDVLGDIADSCGMDASVVLRLLATEEDRRDIVDRDAAARGMGVTSVPTFIVASQHAVPGAQPTDLWLKVLDDIEEQKAAQQA